MSEKTDQLKGKGKEAIGRLTGNKDLESEGKADRRGGETKEKLSDAKGKVEEVIDKARARRIGSRAARHPSVFCHRDFDALVE